MRFLPSLLLCTQVRRSLSVFHRHECILQITKQSQASHTNIHPPYSQPEMRWQLYQPQSRDPIIPEVLCQQILITHPWNKRLFNMQGQSSCSSSPKRYSRLRQEFSTECTLFTPQISSITWWSDFQQLSSFPPSHQTLLRSQWSHSIILVVKNF